MRHNVHQLIVVSVINNINKCLYCYEQASPGKYLHLCLVRQKEVLLHPFAKLMLL